MKSLIQPENGIARLVAAIKKAKKSIDIVIFRFDRAELEAGLKAAAKRGVSVSALIAYANHGGEKSLGKLEMRLLKAGVTVSRTAAFPSTSPTSTSTTVAASALSRGRASSLRRR
jgi:phosphatidylserine/phosphatidylglycerophosphate/cardiolipin synthase-like enzyme